MPAPETNLRIDRFGDRVRWAIEHLPSDPAVLRFAAEPNDIHRAMAAALGPVAAMSQKTWVRALRDHSVPPAYVHWLREVYPDLTFDLIKTPGYDAFLAAVGPLTEARRHWTMVLDHYAKHRDALALAGKRYHRSVDAAQCDGFAYPDFPLVVRDGWLLNSPAPLVEAKEVDLPKLGFAPAPTGVTSLQGLHETLMAFRSRQLNRKNPGRLQYDGDCYRVLGVRTMEGAIDFEFGPGKYTDYVNTCEILGVELAEWHMANPGAEVPVALAHRGAPDALFDFSNRTASAGINCVTLLLNYPKVGGSTDGNFFLVHERGEATLEAQNTVHVIPAGSHEPLKTGFGDDREIQIWHTVVREFVEELFDKEQLMLPKRQPQDFLDQPGVRTIVDAFFRGTRNRPPCARVFLLGVGLDPVTTKPEILTAVVVNWRRAVSNDIGGITWNWEGQGDWVNLSAESLLREARGYVRTSKSGQKLSTLPAGAACLQLAARHLPLLLGEVP